MIYVKTAAGRQALTERSEIMLRKYHFPFLMCDGIRDSSDILTANAAQGFSDSDLEKMLALGFIEPAVRVAAVPKKNNALIASAPTAENLQKLKQKASQSLQKVLGPQGDSLCLLLENCKTQTEFDARFEKTVQMLSQIKNPAVAAAYKEIVLGF